MDRARAIGLAHRVLIKEAESLAAKRHDHPRSSEEFKTLRQASNDCRAAARKLYDIEDSVRQLVNIFEKHDGGLL
jgi:predicted metallo-beta-lactamase superfamily hydrolase